jgi:hypothetical protein
MPTYGKCFSCLWAIPYCMTFPFSEYCTACILKHSFQFAVFNSDPPFYLVCTISIIRNFTYVNIVYVILRISIFCCWIQQAADSFASTNIEDFKSQRTIQRSLRLYAQVSFQTIIILNNWSHFFAIYYIVFVWHGLVQHDCIMPFICQQYSSLQIQS